MEGSTVAAQASYFAQHWDHLRTAVTLEPRGGALTSSAVLVPPVNPKADLGVFFMEPFGYPTMCGSDTISLVTALIETGQIPASGETATVRLDTPAGLVTAEARIAPTGVESVTFTNVPGFLALDLEKDAPTRVGGVARPLLEAAAQRLTVQHPTEPAINQITHVMVYDRKADAGFDARVQVVVPPDVLDRSPCGTGTTARTAVLVAKGLLGLGGTVTHTSLTGQQFTGRAVRDVDLGSEQGTEVTITGRGYVIGDGNIYIDERDPLAHGYTVE